LFFASDFPTSSEWEKTSVKTHSNTIRMLEDTDSLYEKSVQMHTFFEDHWGFFVIFPCFPNCKYFTYFLLLFLSFFIDSL
jgi:hypothetical protein